MIAVKSDEEDTICLLNELIQELDTFSPKSATSKETVIYRQIYDESIDDSLPSEESEEIFEESEPFFGESPIPIPDIARFKSTILCPIVAVDSGIVRLGEGEQGIIIALRATLVKKDTDSSVVYQFRTGPLYLSNKFKKEILHLMGKQLGKEDLFVDLEIDGFGNSKPLKIKRGVADDVHQYSDRFRNWFERLIQKIAVNIIENGIILFDGALTLRTRDTPTIYLQQLAESAHKHGNAIISISKQSKLQIQNRSIKFWLQDDPNTPGYRLLSGLMRHEGSERVLGNVYAARFSSLGSTFRMDVKANPGQFDFEAINQLFTSVLMRGGYPDILVQAHAYSYFTSPDVMQLQASAGVRYKLMPLDERNLLHIFAPFGGRFK